MKPMFVAFGVVALAFGSARAGGPVAPKGWSGSYAPTLPGGQACCIAADLNGTGLNGGAFVLLADNKRKFAVFALTYSSSQGQPKDGWHLLEEHPIRDLSKYEVSIASQLPSRASGVQVCEAQNTCRLYYWLKSKGTFVKSAPAKE